MPVLLLRLCKALYNEKVKLSKEESKDFEARVRPYLNDPNVFRMNDFVAHGKISVLAHSVNVASMAYKLDQKLKLHCDKDTLLTGAILHDYYLYDWHDARLFINIFKMHGFTHPEAARKNAVRDFGVDEKTQKVISSHMWPLTLRSFPSSKEAALVCLADKICALKETFQRW